MRRERGIGVQAGNSQLYDVSCMSMFRPLILSRLPRTRPRILRAKRWMLYLKTERYLSDGTWVFKANRPLLIHTTKIIATLRISTLRKTGKYREMSIPPWAYKMHRISSISGWYEPLSLDGSSSLDAGGGVRAGAGPCDSLPSDSCTNVSSGLELRSPRSPVGRFRRVCSLARLFASCQSFLAQIHSASNLPKSGS